MIVQYSFVFKKIPKLVVMNNESVCAKQKHNGRKRHIWIKDKENLGEVRSLK